MVESSTLLLGSAPMAVLLQPSKHPPAIQSETLNTSVKRKAFIERNEIIFAQQSTPQAQLCREKAME